MKLAVVFAALLLSVLTQSALYRRFWRRGLQVRLDFCRPAAVEGDTAQIKEIIINRQYLPLPVLHVKFQMDRHLVFTSSGNFRITDQNYRSDIFSCLPWQEIRRTLDFSCRKRGYYTIGRVDLVSYDLLLLDHFVATLPARTALYVYPGPADPARLELPLKNLMGQILARQALLRDPFELQGTRPYRPTDPYRHINWKATAHTGELQVNVYAPASSWQAVLLLDTDSDRPQGDDGLAEEAVRLCGSTAERLIGRGIPVAVVSNGTDCLSGRPSAIGAGAGGEHLDEIMKLLARLRFAARTPLSAADLRAMAGIRYMAPEYAERDGISGRKDPADPERNGTSGRRTPAGPGADGGASLPMERLIPLLLDAADSSGASASSVYVLISPVRRDALFREFGTLCRKSPGSVWILPGRPGDPPAVPGADPSVSPQIYEWEVPYDRSQAV